VIERRVLHNVDLVVEAWHTHPALCDGFHGAEGGHRWTNGLGRLPDAMLSALAGASFTLELHLAPSILAYRLPAAARSAAAA
jgi:hypothetical protein